MTPDDPFLLLNSERPIERLRGARLLADLETLPSVSRIRHMRNSESDSWVKAALDRALAKHEQSLAGSDIGETWISVPDDDLEDVKAKAIESVTQVILHEIRPLVADIKLSSRRLLGAEYENSMLEHRVDRLQGFLSTLHRLHEAAAAPQDLEFDLSDFIVKQLRLAGYSEDQVIPTRKDTVIVRGDPDLLSLVFMNAVRNAIEASLETKKPIIVNCSSTDSEAWVAVLDEGIGLPEASERVWDPGVTKKSKDEHFGWGLVIAQRAIHSLGGTIKLAPRDGGGTSCLIRWPAATYRKDI